MSAASSTPHALWLQEIQGDADPAPALEGAERADVAIVGGGYVGLWTAITIKRDDPDRDVVVLEQETCGYGASGRNGGFALSWWAKLPTLVTLCGEAEALRLCRASDDAIDQLEAISTEHGIDVGFRRGGFLWTATTPSQLGAWDDAVTTAERLDVDAFTRLSPEDVARRAGSDRHIAGVLEPRAATVHPARLARALRRIALELGVRLFEHTRVTALDRARPAVLRTAQGALVADRVVLATNAWAAALRELHHRLVVVSSDVVATAPIPDRLTGIGWTGGEAVSDSQLMVDYYRTTDDGRIVFGKGGWTIGFAGHVRKAFDRHPRRLDQVAAALRDTYPTLADVSITHGWSGPIDRPAMGVPLIGHLGRRAHIVYGVGWSGNGVAPAVVGGRILASLALGRRDEWSQSPLVNGVPGMFPPEPVRFLGAHVVRTAVARKERAERQNRAPHRLDTALARLAPGSFASGQSDDA